MRGARGGIFGRIALVAVLLALAACLVAVRASAATVSGGGWDVSWPQCLAPPSSSSHEALPVAPSLGIVGVNDGSPFTTNPCLGSELTWAGSAAAVYINTADPGPSSANWPKKATEPKTCVAVDGSYLTGACAYDYGWNSAKNAEAAFAASVPTTLPAKLGWWLDVEAGNTWQSSAALNTDTINGIIAYLRSTAVTNVASVGIYTNRDGAATIFTPSGVAAGTLSWLATGQATEAAALSVCGDPGFTGAGIAMVQYWPTSIDLDADAPCVGYLTGGLETSAGHTSQLTIHLLSAPASPVTLTVRGTGDELSGSAAGPWTPDLTETVAGTLSSTFYYRPTVAGDPVLTVTGDSVGTIAADASVVPGPLARVAISPAAATLAVGASHRLTVVGEDAFGNVLPSAPAASWSSSVPLYAGVAAGPSGQTTVTGNAAGTTDVTARVAGVASVRATVTVIPPAGRGLGEITGPGAVVAGAVSAPLRVRLWTSKATRIVVRADGGEDLRTATGGWTDAVTVNVASGGIFSTPFYVRDTRAGQLSLVARIGTAAVLRTETVRPAAPVRLAVTPVSVRMAVGASHRLTAVGIDAFGNREQVAARWTVTGGSHVHVTAGPTGTAIVDARSAGTAEIVASNGAARGRAVIDVVR